jgi:hypothetical protein
MTGEAEKKQTDRSKCENVSEPIFHLPFSLTYTSVTQIINLHGFVFLFFDVGRD